MKLTDIFKTNQKQIKIKAKLNLTNVVKEEILGEDELDWDFDFDQTDPAAREAEKDMKKYQKKRKGSDTDEDVLLGGDVEEAAPKGLEKSQQRPNRLKPDMFWKRNEDDSTSVMHSKEHGEHENALIDRLWKLGAGVIPTRRETIKAMRDDEGNYIGDEVKQNYPHIDNVLSQDQIEMITTQPGGAQGTDRDKVKMSQDAHDAADAFGYDIVQNQSWMVKGKSKIPIYKNTLHQGSHYNDAKQDWADRGGYKSSAEISTRDVGMAKRSQKDWADEEQQKWRRENPATAAKGAVEMDMTDPQLTKDELLNLSIGQMRQLDKQFTYGIFDALSDDLSDDEKEAIEDEFDSIMAYKAETAAKAKATRKKTQRMVDRGEKEATMTARQKMEDDEKFKKGIEDLKKRHNKKKKPRDGDANEAEELDPRQKKRKQGKDFKGYKNTMPYTNRKFYPNMSDEEWKAKQGDDVDEERRDPEGQDPFDLLSPRGNKFHLGGGEGGMYDDRSGKKDRRDPNIRRSSVPQHYPDYDTKKKEYVTPKQRKGDDVDEISMQQARKSYGVGQGKTMAGKQRQMKGLGGAGSSQKNYAKRHKAIGAKTGQVRRSVGGPKVIAQTQKRKRAAKMSDMVKGLGNVGRKAIYGGDDSVREQKVTKLNKNQLLEFVKETIKEIIND